jgi:hypothetical protein
MGQRGRIWAGLAGLVRVRWRVGFVVPCLVCLGSSLAARDWC